MRVDELNLDVLLSIFALIHSPADLCSISLVNRAFYAAAVSILYASIEISSHHLSPYAPQSPWATIASSPELASYLRRCEIRHIPANITSTNRFSQYVMEMSQAIIVAPHINGFCWTPNLMKPIPYALLHSLSAKANALSELRIVADLAHDDARLLFEFKSLSTLALEKPSCTILNILDPWLTENSSSLRVLCLSHSPHLNGALLTTFLARVPLLHGCHVVSCPQIDHVNFFQLAIRLKCLRSISFSVFQKSNPGFPGYANTSTLPNLTAITAHIHSSANTSPFPFRAFPFYIARNHLKALTLKFHRPTLLDNPLVNQILDAYQSSISRLNFINATLSLEMLHELAQRAVKLEQLALALPPKASGDIAEALSPSVSLRLLINAGPSSRYSVRLGQVEVKNLMTKCVQLCRVVSDGKIWHVERAVQQVALQIQVDRHRGAIF